MFDLNSEEIIKIESAAKEVLLSIKSDENGETTFPVNLAKILKTYSINVFEGKFKDENVSGAYDGKNKIYISRFDPYPRKSFTVAHELGHFFLHDKGDAEIFYRSQLVDLYSETKKKEIEANWFAASLLMPEEPVKKYWELTHSVDKLSVLFGTSPSATFYRLKNLGLIK